VAFKERVAIPNPTYTNYYTHHDDSVAVVVSCVWGMVEREMEETLEHIVHVHNFQRRLTARDFHVANMNKLVSQPLTKTTF
jgi:hypothetical protein